MNFESTSITYFILANMTSIIVLSLTVGPLCTGLISAWFNLVRSKNYHTFPFGLEMKAKLLIKSDDFSTPNGTMICSLSN